MLSVCVDTRGAAAGRDETATATATAGETMPLWLLVYLAFLLVAKTNVKMLQA